MPQADEIQELLGRTWAGRYEILEFVGRGGMGLVFKARQIQMDREVALKVVHRKLCTEEKQVQRFQQEARTSSKLNHPNSIRVYDYGTTEDGRLFMAMEFLRGLTLGQLLLREGPQHPERVVHIARQMFKSLAEAHQLGLVHRDLKPENIFICDIYGETDFVKVLDFGIAKAIGPHADGANLTQTGFICGTPRYLSPEQALGQDVDGRADLYSVGVLMYEMLSGRPPFIGENPISIVMKHVHDDPPPLGGLERHGALGRKLVWLIDRLLEKNAARRATPADRIVAYLDGLIDESELMGQPLQHALSPAPGPTDGLAQRRPTVLGMQASALVAGGATLNMPPAALAAPKPGFKEYGAGGAETTRPVTAMYDAIPPPLPGPAQGGGPAMTGPGFPLPVSHGAETSMLIPEVSPYAAGPSLPPFHEAGDHQHTALIARPESLGASPAAETLIEENPGEMTRQMDLDEVRSADRAMRDRNARNPATSQLRRRTATGSLRPVPLTASVAAPAPQSPRDPVWTWALVGIALSVLLLSAVVWWWSGQPPRSGVTVSTLPAAAPAVPRAEPPAAVPVVAASAAAAPAPTQAAAAAPAAEALPPPEAVVVAAEEAIELEAEPEPGMEIGEILVALELPPEPEPLPEAAAEPEPAAEPAGVVADPLYGNVPPEPRAAPAPRPKPKAKPKPRKPREQAKPKPAPAKPATKPVFEIF